MKSIEYREKRKTDNDAVNKLIEERWGTAYVVVHNTLYLPGNLGGFIALDKGKMIGLITYIIENKECEIVTLDSLKENCGMGSKLIELAVEEAKKNNCSSIWLITTNDNLRAISFYEKRGFELTHIFADAVEESRKIKPEIPLMAENGILIKDELKYVKQL